MKHTEQSLQTKQALSVELKRLMKSKPLNRITVSELVSGCGLNRKTFYYHFEDIYSLLKWTLEQEAVAHFGEFDLAVQYNEAIHFALDYVDNNRVLLRNIVHSIGRSELSRFFFADIYVPLNKFVYGCIDMRGLKISESYIIFLSKFLTEAIAGMLIDRIERDDRTNRDELSESIIITLNASINASLEQAEKKFPV